MARERAGRPTSDLPVGELFGFAAPVFVSALVWQLMEASDALLLGYFGTAESVATFRAVLPIARLNQAAFLTFSVFYLPHAAGLHAREGRNGLSELYGSTAVWMTLLTLPIFLLTFAFAPGLTGFLYGERYAESAPIMALTALAYFVHTALGFNAYTLRIFGKLKVLLALDVAAAAVNIGLGVVLVPTLGPLGAAIAFAASMVGQNLLRQVVLWRETGITLLHRPFGATYAVGATAAIALLALGLLLRPPFWVGVGLAAVGWLACVWASRAALRVEAMFPELGRWPVLRAAAPLLRAR
jgi:O-antigen/teichoic acid export membrane protein